MAQDTQHPEGSLGALEAQLRECFARVAYSHKTHEKAADLALQKLRKIKLWQIGMSAVTTGGIIVVVFGEPTTSQWSAIVAALLSTALLALNTYTKDNDPGQLAEKHKETAARLWKVRELYLSLLTDLHGGLVLDEARSRRDELLEELGAIYQGAPRTTNEAYKLASGGLKEIEELTFTNEEIDKFLPPPLRRAG
jgi:hypothetical protein